MNPFLKEQRLRLATSLASTITSRNRIVNFRGSDDGILLRDIANQFHTTGKIPEDQAVSLEGNVQAFCVSNENLDENTGDLMDCAIHDIGGKMRALVTTCRDVAAPIANVVENTLLSKTYEGRQYVSSRTWYPITQNLQLEEFADINDDAVPPPEIFRLELRESEKVGSRFFSQNRLLPKDVTESILESVRNEELIEKAYRSFFGGNFDQRDPRYSPSRFWVSIDYLVIGLALCEVFARDAVPTAPSMTVTSEQWDKTIRDLQIFCLVNLKQAFKSRERAFNRKVLILGVEVEENGSKLAIINGETEDEYFKVQQGPIESVLGSITRADDRGSMYTTIPDLLEHRKQLMNDYRLDMRLNKASNDARALSGFREGLLKTFTRGGRLPKELLAKVSLVEGPAIEELQKELGALSTDCLDKIPELAAHFVGRFFFNNQLVSHFLTTMCRCWESSDAEGQDNRRELATVALVDTLALFLSSQVELVAAEGGEFQENEVSGDGVD